MIAEAEVWVTPIRQKLHYLALSEDELMRFGDGAMQVHSHQAVTLVQNNYKFHFNCAVCYNVLKNNGIYSYFPLHTKW